MNMPVTRMLPLCAAGSLIVIASSALAGDWVTYANETSVRLQAANGLGVADLEEKDYAWADLDDDGDIDLVVVRKQPFTSAGRRRNVLFMNENGVLVDRTESFAMAADDGGEGFLDLTNDRDVTISDLDGDGWLDVITCTACNGCPGQPKTITHPRIYMNLGDDGNGDWLGLIYEESRMPQFSQDPNFCAVAAGDVTGDLLPDLYMVDYSSSLEDRLLINDGNGFFTDQSESRMSIDMRASGFGTAGDIRDMNLDGWNDVVKSENGPVKTINNGGAGFFDIVETTYGGAAYHMSVGELNNDGRLDIVISDDGTDRYLLNSGNGGNGMANFQSLSFPGETGGFGSNSVIADLDNNGFNDVLIADVDVDISGCSRISDILRNNSNPPNVSFSVAATTISDDFLQGVHDFAVFDVNGDGFRDIVIGRCQGTQIWVNAPPIGINYSYPDGLPALLDPNVTTTFPVSLVPLGDTLIPDSPTIHVATNGGKSVSTQLTLLGKGLYEATLPAGVCSDRFDFYFTAQLSGGLSFNDPGSAPASFYTAISSEGTVTILEDSIEGDVSGWTIINDPSLTGGAWEQADPNGTIAGGELAAPENDATPDGTMAWVTENGPPGGAASATDVDGGPTQLLTPMFDLQGSDAFISYTRWAFSKFDAHDALVVEISNDAGDNWALVESIEDTGSSWAPMTIQVSDYVEPSSEMQMRFSISDLDFSTTEAGIDDLVVNVVCLSALCLEDLTDDDVVGTADLLELLSGWGPNPGHPADFDGDGSVGTADLLQLLSAWGPCPK